MRVRWQAGFADTKHMIVLRGRSPSTPWKASSSMLQVHRQHRGWRRVSIASRGKPNDVFAPAGAVERASVSHARQGARLDFGRTARVTITPVR
ncbi:MAG: hypothetical protein WKH97_20270 [Casimicrobiaceae bacterium]